MQPNDVVKLTIPAKPEYVGVVRLFISGLANRLGFNFDEIEDMKVAVAEACTNAVTHAYPDAEGMIHIQCYVYLDRLEIHVIDQGKSFNLDQIKRQSKPITERTPIEELYEGGLGLYLIETLMDQVKIETQGGIKIQMTKFKEVESNGRPCEPTTV